MKGWSFGETASINDGHETESAAETAAAASPRQSLTVNSLRHSPSRNSRLSSASRYTSKQQQQQQQKGGISDSTINDFSTSHTGGGGLLTGHSTLPFDSFQPSIHLTGDRNDPIQSIAASEKLDVVEDISSGLILEVESENCGNSIIIFDIAAKTPPLSENQTGVIPKEAKEDTIQFVLNGEDSASGTEENKVERTMTERTTKICESPLSSYEQLQEKNPSTLSQPAAVIITKSKASSLNNSNNNSNNDAHSSNNSQLTSENDESSLRSVEEFPHSIRPVHHASTPSNHSRTTPLLNTLLKERVLAIHQQQYRPNNPSSGGSNTSLNETTASNVAGHGRARSTSREKSNSLYSHTTSNTGSNQSLNVEGTVGGAGLNRPNHARSLSREKNIYVASQHGFSFGSLPVDLLNGGGSGGGGVGINASISGTGLVPSTGRRPSVSAGGNPGGIASPSLDWRSSIRADSVSSSQSKKNSLVTNQKMGTGDAVERYQQFLGNARRASISFNPNKSDTFLMHAWNQSASALPGLDTAGGGGGAATASSSSIRNLGNLPDIGRASFKALPFLSEGGGGISSSPASITTAAKNQPGVLDQRQNLSVSVDMPSSSFISSDLKVVLINTEALTLKSILNGLAPAPADLTSFQEFCKDPFWSGKMSISPSLLLEFWITAESLKFTKDTDSYLENIDYIIKTYINVINFPQITKNDALDNAIKAQNNVEYGEFDAKIFVEAQNYAFNALETNVLSKFNRAVTVKRTVSLAESEALWWRHKQSLKRFFSYADPVNSSETRLYAAVNVIWLIVAVLANIFMPVVPYWGFVAVLFFNLMKLISGPRLDPQSHLVLFTLKPIFIDCLKLMRKNKFRSSPSYRFAQSLDVLLYTACCLLSLLGYPIPTYTIAGVLAVLSLIYSIFDLSLGRSFFAILLSRGWLPKSVKQASSLSFFYKDDAALAPVATQHFKSLTFT